METANYLIQITEDKLREIVGNEVEKRIRGHLNRANDKFMTRQEAANHLKVTLPTIDKLVRNGELKAYKLSGRVLMKLSDVNQAVDLVK